MQRSKAFKRGRAVPILVPMLTAAGIGYLIGGWNVTASRSTEISAAESVALRFPQNWDNASPAPRAAIAVTATTSAGQDAQFALLSPEPMVPQANPQANPQVIPQAAPQAISEAVSQPAVQTATAEEVGSSPAPDSRPQSQARPAAAQPPSEIKAAAVASHRRAENRPGYMLNDSQIASIKERLHMTSYQERMWPAVEAALRNVAYVRAQEAHGRGVPASTAQAASVDPNGVEVQGLKSAAVPLIMSFNAEQKEEVRNLAHVMGLDQLASQF
jgi:hypothetical protein